MQLDQIKEIFILSCYPNVPEKERLLLETVEKLKSLNKTVLIASHFPISDFIVKKCDYYLYDANNMIDLHNHTLEKSGSDYWMRTDHFLIETTIIHHVSALSRIFGITMEFIKSIGYNYFVVLETDAEYDIDDLKKFDTYKNKLVELKKELFFFKPKFTEFTFQNERVYETYCFGGFLDRFLEKFKFPINMDGWNKLISENSSYKCLEYLLLKKFVAYEDNYLIMETLKSQFVNSRIDLFTVGESSGLYYNESNELRPIIFLHNHDHLGRKSLYEVKINLHGIKYYELECGMWTYFDLDLEYEKTISVQIKTYRDGKLYAEHFDYINKDNLKEKKQFKRFKFLK